MLKNKTYPVAIFIVLAVFTVAAAGAYAEVGANASASAAAYTPANAGANDVAYTPANAGTNVMAYVATNASAGIVSGYQIEQAAAICRDMGVLRGGINGVDGAYLAEYSTRLQAIQLTVRLMGKEEAATTYKWTDNFGDASLAGYIGGRNALAYVKSHPELGWQGDKYGNINPSGFLTSQAMYKVLLSVLGYALGDDFLWDDAIEFAGLKGMRAMSQKRGYLTNNDVSAMLVEALKTRMKGSEDTLCERLVGTGVVNAGAAGRLAMLPGSSGYRPLLAYKNGGPLLVETALSAEYKTVSIKLNTALNPTYAKALKSYNYYMPGSGYIPLPSRCMTKMLDENTVQIQFPGEGWVSYSDKIESDAFLTYIATDRKNELRISGLYDVDGELLRDLYIDVPAPPNGHG